MRRSKAVPHLACIATMIIWGLSFVSIDYCLTVIRPMSLAFVRFLIATILLFVITRFSKSFEKIQKKDIFLMALSGVVGISIYFYFENNGILMTDPSIASLLLATIPLFTLISDVIIFKEKLTIRKWIGIFVSIVGVVLIIGVNFGGGSTFKGTMYMLGAVMAWVIYSVATKPLTKKYSQITIVYYQAMYGAIALFPFTFMERNDLDKVNFSIILNVLYLAIACSVIGYIFYVYAVDNLGISISSFYINFMPLVTVVGSYFILGTTISRNAIIGGVLVILSVFIISESNADVQESLENEVVEV